MLRFSGINSTKSPWLVSIISTSTRRRCLESWPGAITTTAAGLYVDCMSVVVLSSGGLRVAGWLAGWLLDEW